MKKLLSILLIVFLSVLMTSAESVTLSWEASDADNIDSYSILYGSKYLSVNRNVGKVTEYTINNLSSGKEYYFVISALDKRGNRLSESNVVNFTISKKREKSKRTPQLKLKIVAE